MEMKENQKSSAFQYFERISRIPRGIENEKAISDYIVSFAKERNLYVYQDKLWNVIVKKAGSPGYENLEPIILQAHMDMVCEKTPDSEHDFMLDPLELYEEDGLLHARGTTLGADDGFGVAYILAVLDDEILKHPPLECVFTSQEESGNWGARYLDKSLLTGKRMIGLDGDQEKSTFVSCYCSHGMKLTHEYEASRASGSRIELELTKFCKGVYGGVIHPECGNVIKMMGRLLGKVSLKGIPYRIIHMESGKGENFNPFEGKLSLMVSEDCSDLFEAEVRKEFQAIMNEFEDDGYRGSLLMKRREGIETVNAMSQADSLCLVKLLHMMPNNLFQDKTINNLGQITVADGRVEILMSGRSAHQSSEEELLTQCRYLADIAAYKMETWVRFASLPHRKDSPLRKLANHITMENWGYELAEEICPGGLEAGWFCFEIADMDVLMLGPDIKGMHTPNECMNMDSFYRVYQLLTCILELMNQAV